MPELRGFKFLTTLFLVFKKKIESLTIFIQAEIIINESDIDDVLESIYYTIKSNIQKSLGKGSS